MALSEEQVLDIVKRYESGDGDTVAALAEAFSVSDQTIRYHLKRRGVYASDAKVETDADLGIGEESPEADYAALLNNPKFLAALAEKLGQSAPKAEAEPSAFAGLVKTMERMIEVQAIQQPGYIKPLSAEEMDRREEGRQKMFALLDRYKEQRTPPHYVLGDVWPANDILYEAGQEVRTYLPPAEHFQPQNDEARQVMLAMYQWLGGPTPDIGETVEAFERWRKGSEVPLVGSSESLKPSDVEVVNAVKRDVQPKRILGNIVPETRGTSQPRQPGVVAPPTGPIFVDS